jgi:biotin-(acetyl-CoA carboxylase) ligase
VSWERARALLGKQVRVKLGDNTIAYGRLLGFGEDGEFEIEEPDGVVHYCWPLLDIEEAE